MPHKNPYFGQDYTISYLVKTMGLIPIFLVNGEYNLDEIKLNKIELIISRYPDFECDRNIIKKFAGVFPIITHLHLKYSFLSSKQKCILSESLSSSNCIITNCTQLNSEYSSIFPKYKWKFVNNGIDSNVFKPSTEDERYEFKSNHGIPKGKIIVTYTGRLNKPKGIQILERLCEYISKSRKFYLIIQSVYHPKYCNKFKELKNKFKNLKIITTQDIKVLRFSDINISTSLCETTSLVTLESLFSGVPVICTNVTEFYNDIDKYNKGFKYFRRVEMPSDFPLIANNEKSKIILSEEDATKLSEAFIERLNETEIIGDSQRNKLGKKWKDSKYEAKKMNKKLEKLYNSVLKKFNN